MNQRTNHAAGNLVERTARMKRFEERNGGILPPAPLFQAAMDGTDDELDQLEAACQIALDQYYAAVGASAQTK